MTRAFALGLLSFSLALGCVSSRSAEGMNAPTLTASLSTLHAPEVGLPFHTASIVDVAMLPPAAGERWRMASGDLDGELRFWADGRLLAAWPAHPGGLAGMAVGRDGTLYTAGFDGRVREWPNGATTPVRTFDFGRPVTAIAVSDRHIALSDGKHVQLWTRAAPPQLEWSMAAHAFVTGLTLTTDSRAIAAAELRESAMRAGIAMHPLAEFTGDRLRAVSPEEQADLRYLAARDFPGAAADYLEIWQTNGEQRQQLVPRAPIDADIGIFSQGGVAYREIYGIDNAGMIGRRLEDRAHVPIALVKPWALFSGQSEDQGQRTQLAVGDFVLGPRSEIIVVDHFPGWDQKPPERGWPVGAQRELSIGHGFAALGDAAGNLAVVELAKPTEPPWRNPGEERPELLAATANTAWIATATLEPRTQYRLWSLAEGVHRAIRVEAPGTIIDQEKPKQSKLEPLPMYALELALDDKLTTLAASLSSFSDPHQAAIRLISPVDGSAQFLSLAAMPDPLEIALTPDASELLAWTPGHSGFRWTGPKWTPSTRASPSGAPYVSANGRYSAHVSSRARTVVERRRDTQVTSIQNQATTVGLGAPLPAAIANDGTLALVEPFGGGVVELIEVGGASQSITLPGAATALAWIEDRDDQAILLVGFQDGSIVRVDREAGSTQPVHAGAGGRVWALAPLGGQPGVFIELDERGLALHRLDDDAMIELHLGDPTTLARDASSPPQAPSNVGLIAIWRPGTAMPICAIYDGSRAGVLAPATIRRLGADEGAEFLGAFNAGQPCPDNPAPALIEPVSLSETPG